MNHADHPARKVALLTCMDPRIQLHAVLETPASDTFVLRNGGGRVTEDVIRGLVLCTRMLGVTEIGVLHHTDCRLRGVTNDQIAARTGVTMDYLPLPRSEAADSVADDIGLLRASGLIPGAVSIWGGLYDVGRHTIGMTHHSAHIGTSPLPVTGLRHRERRA